MVLLRDEKTERLMVRVHEMHIPSHCMGDEFGTVSFSKVNIRFEMLSIVYAI